ncbi:hypothetical protein [Nostoc sp.]
MGVPAPELKAIKTAQIVAQQFDKCVEVVGGLYECNHGNIKYLDKRVC